MPRLVDAALVAASSAASPRHGIPRRQHDVLGLRRREVRVAEAETASAALTMKDLIVPSIQQDAHGSRHL
jgi:hypothetical protein